MFGLSLASVQIAGIFKLHLEEVIGGLATRATVIVMNPPLNAVSPVTKNALLTASSKVSIIRTNKR